MNILHEKRRLLPMSGPQEPVTAFIIANAATIATGAAIGAVTAAVTGGNILKGALMGAVFAGVGSAASQAINGTLGATGAAAEGGLTAPAASTAFDVNTALSEGGSSAAGTAMQSVPANAVTGANLAAGTAQPSIAGTSILSAPSATAIQSTPVTVATGGTQVAQSGTGLLDKALSGLTSEKGMASLVQVGGNAISGYAQGQAQQEMYDQKQRDARFATPVNRGLLSYAR